MISNDGYFNSPDLKSFMFDVTRKLLLLAKAHSMKILSFSSIRLGRWRKNILCFLANNANRSRISSTSSILKLNLFKLSGRVRTS